MATRTIRVCDTCESTADVETFEIKTGDRRIRVDLCGEHGKPLTELLTTATVPATKPVDDGNVAERAAKRKAARERRAAEKAATERLRPPDRPRVEEPPTEISVGGSSAFGPASCRRSLRERPGVARIPARGSAGLRDSSQEPASPSTSDDRRDYAEAHRSEASPWPGSRQLR